MSEGVRNTCRLLPATACFLQRLENFSSCFFPDHWPVTILTKSVCQETSCSKAIRSSHVFLFHHFKCVLMFEGNLIMSKTCCQDLDSSDALIKVSHRLLPYIHSGTPCTHINTYKYKYKHTYKHM